ncbi:MAG: TatD family hydrolase [Candidatus Nanohaloarchaea archaeon]
MRPVDSHCHLQFEQFDTDREEVVKSIEKGLDSAVVAGIDPVENEKAVETAEISSQLSYCLGLHPLHHEKSLEKVRQQIQSFDPVAVGEIGLDYNYITGKKEREETEKVFRRMLDIAEVEGLNAVIHSRNAEQKAFEIVKEYDVTGFFHCFNGRPELASEIAEKHFVGVTTQVVDSTRVRNIVKEVGMDSMLVETDSPYLGLDGRNTPLNVSRVVDEIADLKQLEREKVVEATRRNSRNFFEAGH